MKSESDWVQQITGRPHNGTAFLICAGNITAIQLDATADLQSQVEKLRGDVEVQIDAKLRAWKLNEDLRAALEKCVVALESIRDFDEDSPFDDPGCIAVDALAATKPLLNKSPQNG